VEEGGSVMGKAESNLEIFHSVRVDEIVGWRCLYAAEDERLHCNQQIYTARYRNSASKFLVHLYQLYRIANL